MASLLYCAAVLALGFLCVTGHRSCGWMCGLNENGISFAEGKTNLREGEAGVGVATALEGTKTDVNSLNRLYQEFVQNIDEMTPEQVEDLVQELTDVFPADSNMSRDEIAKRLTEMWKSLPKDATRLEQAMNSKDFEKLLADLMKAFPGDRSDVTNPQAAKFIRDVMEITQKNASPEDLNKVAGDIMSLMPKGDMDQLAGVLGQWESPQLRSIFEKFLQECTDALDEETRNELPKILTDESLSIPEKVNKLVEVTQNNKKFEEAATKALESVLKANLPALPPPGGK